MTEISCNIIRDLLPSYADGLTSEETNLLVGEHLADCAECRHQLEGYQMDLHIQLDKPKKSDRKIVRKMRFQLVWYLFWPLLYLAGFRFGLIGVNRFMVLALVGIFWVTMSHNTMYNFDTDDTKAEFYEREARNIAQGKGSFFVQGIIWALPIGVPLLFSLIPYVVSQFR